MAGERHRWRGEVWVPLAYLLVGVGWIEASGALAERLASDATGLARLEQLKGWAFIFGTTALLYVLLRAHARRLEAKRAHLVEAEVRYRLLAERTAMGIVIAVDGRVAWANAAAHPLLLGEAPPQALAGRELADFVHPDEHADVWREALAGEPVDRFARRRLRRLDGVAMDVDVGVTRTEWEGRPALHLTLHDVTALSRLTRAFRLLADGTSVALRATDETTLCEGVCRAAVDSGGLVLAWVGLATGDQLHVVADASREPAVLEALRPLVKDLRAGTTPAAAAQRIRARVVIDDVAAADDFPEWRAAVSRQGVKTAIALPLVVDGETLGVLSAASREPAHFVGQTVQVFEQLADAVAFGLGRVRLAARAREAEAALVEREHEAVSTAALLRATYEAITDAVVVYDARGVVTAANEAARVALGGDPTGLTADQVSERVGLAVVHPTPLEQALAGSSTVDTELSVPALPGLSLLFSAFPARGPRGEVSGAVTVTRDNTERERQAAALRALATRFDHALEAHEARLGRDLHDDLGQSLTALKLTLAALERQVDTAGPAAPALVDRVVETSALVDEALARLKAIVAGLRPSALEHLGLAAALRGEVRAFAARSGVACDLSLDDALAPGPETSAALFRIAQEALTNVARHAAATRVHVTLEAADGGARLVVRDDGRGFTPRSVALSLGLLGMRERAAALGGQVRVDSAPGAGATVTAWVPGLRGPLPRGGDGNARPAGR